MTLKYQFKALWDSGVNELYLTLGLRDIPKSLIGLGGWKLLLRNSGMDELYLTLSLGILETLSGLEDWSLGFFY